jgi:hypothetical protein
MKLIDFYNGYGLRYTHSLLSIIFTDNTEIVVPIQKEKLEKFIKTDYPDLKIKWPVDCTNFLELISKVNKEVKHQSCPNNLRNRFYHKKKMFIQYLRDKGLCDKIIESESVYKFVIGEYSFHQPKAYFPGGIKNIDGTEEYIPTEPEIPFSMDDYKKCMIGILYLFINKKKYTLTKI